MVSGQWSAVSSNEGIIRSVQIICRRQNRLVTLLKLRSIKALYVMTILITKNKIQSLKSHSSSAEQIKLIESVNHEIKFLCVKNLYISVVSGQ